MSLIPGGDFFMEEQTFKTYTEELNREVVR
jgi:hypothetical protein